jgi:hypothetical protein
MCEEEEGGKVTRVQLSLSTFSYSPSDDRMSDDVIEEFRLPNLP